MTVSQKAARRSNRLLDDGAIPSQGLHRSRDSRVLLSDVVEFQERCARMRERRRRIAETVEADDDLEEQWVAVVRSSIGLSPNS